MRFLTENSIFEKAVALSLIIAAHSAFAEQEEARYWDFNGDGKEDIWYYDIEADMSYLEISDRNFDGKDDLKVQYDSNSHWPVGAFADDDFDGHYETRYFYENAALFATFSDSDRDNYFDVAHYYKNQIISTSKKYTTSTLDQAITTLVHEFDFPVSNSTEPTRLTPKEFHESLVLTIPNSQSTPTKRSN